MRFTSIIVAGAFAAFASAASSATATTGNSVTSTVSTGPIATTDSATAECIKKCKEGDVSCTAACINVRIPTPPTRAMYVSERRHHPC